MPEQRTGNMDNRSGFAFDLAGSSSKFIDAHHLERYSPYQRKSLLLRLEDQDVMHITAVIIKHLFG